MMCGETIRKTDYPASRSQLFLEMPNTVHKESPIPAQHFQGLILAIVNMYERNDQNNSCYDKQNTSRTSKNAIPYE